MPRDLEPGLIRAFRYFTFVALCYYAIVILYTVVQTGQGLSSVQIQLYLNFICNLALFIYLSLPGLIQRLHRFYLPIALLLAAGIPVLSNLIFLAPPISESRLIVEPTWLLFPTLLVTVVVIAWQYSYYAVLMFTVAAALVEIVSVYPLVGRIDSQTLPILGLPLLRAFAFALVGQIVSRMVSIQRVQRRELIRSNIKLSQNAAMLEQLTLSRERNRLARELHDTLAHTLSGQAVNLEAIKLMLQPEQTEVASMIDLALKTTRDGLTEVRRAVKDLRTQTVEDLGLSLAIRNLALEAAARADFVPRLEIAEKLPHMSSEAEHAFYRIAQESFANIVQHANAKQVTLRLTTEKNRICLSIVDDGNGANLDRVDSTHSHGILGMKERAMMVNGDLKIESRPGFGTTIQFSMEAPND